MKVGEVQMNSRRFILSSDPTVSNYRCHAVDHNAVIHRHPALSREDELNSRLQHYLKMTMKTMEAKHQRQAIGQYNEQLGTFSVVVIDPVNRCNS